MISKTLYYKLLNDEEGAKKDFELCFNTIKA